MCMPRRALDLGFACLLAISLAGRALQAEPTQADATQAEPTKSQPTQTVLIQDLGKPTALSLRFDDKQTELLLAEGRGKVSRLLYSSDSEISDRVIQQKPALREGVEIEGGCAGLAFTKKNLAIAAGRGIHVLQYQGLQYELLQKVKNSGSDLPCTSIAVGSDKVFAVAGGKLFRSRVVSTRLNVLRQFDPKPSYEAISLAMSDRGYLVVLGLNDQAEAVLAFYDPHLAGTTPIMAICQGVEASPRAICYGMKPAPVEKPLYLLDSAGWIHRLDATAPVSGEMAVAATRVAQVEGAQAFVLGENNEFFVATWSEEQQSGAIVRLELAAD